MLNTTKIITAVSIIGSIAIATVGTSTFAFHGDGNGEQKQIFQQAVADGDYDTWYSLVKEKACNPPILETVTEENFGQFQKMHKLMQEGDFDGAKAIADELGLKRPGFKMGNRGKGKRFAQEENE